MNSIKLDTVTIGTRSFVKYISQEEIQSRIAALGKALAINYQDRNPLFVVVLNGAFMFAADLLRAYPYDCEVQFIRLASYEGTSSSGKVRQILGLAGPVKDRHLIIVEDIVDTGATMHYFKHSLNMSDPASVEFVTLLLKPDCLNYTFQTPYVGFEIPDKFVVGYGLDLDGVGRNLSSIYQLEQ
jgi:hypoxanthine phosphoribosyltransferase